jgi:uncharacterized protein YutE (UPF0331/DUF86 family)
MPFSRFAEQRIQDALARGEFDNLPNAGQPLNLDEYFSAPADLRMAYSILKNARCAPAEVELLSEIARLRQALVDATDEAERDRLTRTVNQRQMQLSILLERRPRGER